MLPIQIPKSTPDQWRSLEKQLIAIAIKEKSLEPRDRKVSKVLPLVQSYAKSREWSALFGVLTERNIIAIDGVVVPQKLTKSPSVRPRQPKRLKQPKPPKPMPLKKQLQAVINKVLLADELTSLITVQSKLRDLGLLITDDVCREYLHEFFKRGLMFSCHSYGSRKAWYALNQTRKIHCNEWFTSTYALAIAKENGYTGLDAYFKQYPYTQRNRKIKPFDFYAQYNLEYREAVEGDKETSYYKFRILIQDNL